MSEGRSKNEKNGTLVCLGGPVLLQLLLELALLQRRLLKNMLGLEKAPLWSEG